MNAIIQTIAKNLQTIRKERQLTLQDLAELTGVSKSMLGEIERGASSPTITVLWKIASGLKIPISNLIHEATPHVLMVQEKDWLTLSDAPEYNLSLIFDYDHTRNFEVYHIDFEPGALRCSQPHQAGVVEYTMVYEGTLTIEVNGKEFVLGKGDSLIFEADKPHSYRNRGEVPTKAYSLIYYSNGHG